MNPVAIESHLKLILVAWVIIIAVASVIGRLGKKLGQPLAVGEILGGLLLGPSCLGAIWPAGAELLFPASTQQSLQLLGKVGLILFLFQVGMEFDFSHLRSRSRTVIAVSLMGILAPMLLGAIVSPWLHREFAPNTPYVGFALFVCVALSITALPIMGRILLELNLERTAIGALSISAAAIDDVAGWILLAVVTALASSGFAWGPLATQAVGTLLFFFFVMLVAGPVLRRVARSYGKSGKVLQPSFLALLLACLFGACLVTNALGIFSIMGAFLLGVSLHQDRRLAKEWRDKFSDFALVALVPIFFTNTGLRTDLGSLSTGVEWLGCLVVLLVATIGKFGGCWLGARVTGQSKENSLCIAALMNTRALMGLVAINVGYELNLLPKELFTMFVIMALVTTAMTGPMLAIWLPKELKKLKDMPFRDEPLVEQSRAA